MFKKYLVGLALLFLGLALGPVFPSFAGEMDFSVLAKIPIQDGGRVKPLDTFARESVRMVTGREQFEGRPSLDTLMQWISEPAPWDTKECGIPCLHAK